VLNQLDQLVGAGPMSIFLSMSEAPQSCIAGEGSRPTTHRLGTLRLFDDLETAVIAARLPTTDAAERCLEALRNASMSGAPCIHLDLEQLTALYELVRSLLRVEREAGVTGLALIETSPTVRRRGLLRSWATHSDTTDVAGRGQAVVRFTGDSLDLERGECHPTIVGLRSFGLGIDGAVVEDAEGQVHVLDEDATNALCDLADGATSWRSRTVPSALVWAGLLEGLEGACDAMRSARRRARVVTGADVGDHTFVS